MPEALPAERAAVGLLPRVNALVDRQGPGLSEALPAVRAAVGAGSGVEDPMGLQVAGLPEALPTVPADVPLRSDPAASASAVAVGFKVLPAVEVLPAGGAGVGPRVRALVYLQAVGLGEAAPAGRAAVRLLSGVDPLVLPELVGATEGFPARRTGVRLLARVDLPVAPESAGRAQVLPAVDAAMPPSPSRPTPVPERGTVLEVAVSRVSPLLSDLLQLPRLLFSVHDLHQPDFGDARGRVLQVLLFHGVKSPRIREPRRSGLTASAVLLGVCMKESKRETEREREIER
ncbi:UNVERIFIED_CONTAM: hypothetical protein FKN15_036498 [Acipenser sinensis]